MIEPPKWRLPHHTATDTLTMLIIAGLRTQRMEWTMNELFDEVDLILSMITIKEVEE